MSMKVDVWPYLVQREPRVERYGYTVYETYQHQEDEVYAQSASSIEGTYETAAEARQAGDKVINEIERSIDVAAQSRGW